MTSSTPLKWHQFRLRSLLVAALIVQLACILWMCREYEVRRRRAAVSAEMARLETELARVAATMPPDGAIRFWATGCWDEDADAPLVPDPVPMQQAAIAAEAEEEATLGEGSPLDQLDQSQIPLYELQHLGVPPPEELVAIVGSSRLRHRCLIGALAFSRSGKQLASGGNNGVIRVWDTGTGAQRCVIRTEEGEVCSLAMSPDGRTLASGHRKSIHLWDLESGRPITELKSPPYYAQNLTFSEDGTFLAAGGGLIKIWKLPSGELQCELAATLQLLEAIVFNPHGSTLATAAKDGVQLWNVDTGKQVRTFGTRPAKTVVFLDGGKSLAALLGEEYKNGKAVGTAEIEKWNVASGTPEATKRFEEPLNTNIAVFDANGDSLAMARAGGGVQLWDVESSQMRHVLTANDPKFYRRSHDLAISPDGKLVAAISDLLSHSYDVHLWNTVSGQAVAGSRMPRIRCADLSPDDSTLALGCQNGSVILWDVSTRHQRKLSDGHTRRVSSIAFGPNGQQLVSGSYDQTVRFWHAKTGELLKTLKLGVIATAAAFSPDGKTLALGTSGRDIRLFEPATGNMRIVGGFPETPYHKGPIHGLSFHPDGRQLAAVESSGRGILWDAERGEAIRIVQSDHSVRRGPLVFSPDGTQLAGVWGKTLMIWNAATAEVLQQFESDHGVTHLAFSPSGQSLASAGEGGTVNLWSLAPPPHVSKTLRLANSPAPIARLFFSANGRHLITVNGNGTVSILRLSPHEDAE